MSGIARRRYLVITLAAIFVISILILVSSTATRSPVPPPTSTTDTPPPSTRAAEPSTSATSSTSATTAAPQPSSAAATPASPAPALAAQKLAAMSLEQRVGQILMVSSPVTGADADSLYAVDSLLVGNVFLKGRSTAGLSGIGAQVAAITSHISGARTEGMRAFVATDHEGGLVQIMQGPGFEKIPQAIEQGQLEPATLQADATRWGQQLAAVGVNVNLAPVLDTVPGPAFAPQNAPIGAFGREYGYTPLAVSSHGLAFARGMMAAGINPTVKHFPGLGRVTANTDVSAGVTDDVTLRHDPYIAPFQDAVQAGVPWLMISNAYYPQIDANQIAPFSTVIVHDMVREDLGFTGIIVSDDICDAVQLSAVPIAARGVGFIRAGGTMALCTNQKLLPAMYQSMVDTAKADPAFAAQVNDAALLVLQAKVAAGLMSK